MEAVFNLLKLLFFCFLIENINNKKSAYKKRFSIDYNDIIF